MEWVSLASSVRKLRRQSESAISLVSDKFAAITMLGDSMGQLAALSRIGQEDRWIRTGLAGATAVACPSAAPPDPLIPTIFHETWWLDTATHGNYGIAETSHAGKVVGRLPYAITRRSGMRCNLLPLLTHFLGPAIDDLEGSANTQFQKRLSICDELIRKLPDASLHKISCHRGVTDIVAFQAARFASGVQFTCEILPADSRLVWKQMRDKTRNVIRRAREAFDVVEIGSQEFLRFYEANLAGKNAYDLPTCARIIEACLDRGRGKIFSAQTADGQLTAAIFCAWDRTSMYYLMSTRSQESGNSAVSLLLWNAIEHAMKLKVIFDFDGFYSNGSILFYTGFGPVIRPRYLLTKASFTARLALEVRDWFRERTYLW